MTYEELQASPFRSQRNGIKIPQTRKENLFDFPAGIFFETVNSRFIAVNPEPVLWHYNNIERITESNGFVYVHVKPDKFHFALNYPYVNGVGYPPERLFNLYVYDMTRDGQAVGQRKLW